LSGPFKANNRKSPPAPPPGGGMGLRPPVYLKGGDVVTLGIEGLGSQRQVVMQG